MDSAHVVAMILLLKRPNALDLLRLIRSLHYVKSILVQMLVIVAILVEINDMVIILRAQIGGSSSIRIEGIRGGIYDATTRASMDYIMRDNCR